MGPKYDFEGDSNEEEDAILTEVIQLKKEKEIIDGELEEMQR